MAEEIIKVLDYIMGNPAVQAFGIAYLVFSGIILSLVVTVFVVTVRQIVNNSKRFGRW